MLFAISTSKATNAACASVKRPTLLLERPCPPTNNEVVLVAPTLISFGLYKLVLKWRYGLLRSILGAARLHKSNFP